MTLFGLLAFCCNEKKKERAKKAEKAAKAGTLEKEFLVDLHSHEISRENFCKMEFKIVT